MMDVRTQFYDLYMKNMVSKNTLDELVSSGKLIRSEVDEWVQIRQNEQGY